MATETVVLSLIDRDGEIGESESDHETFTEADQLIMTEQISSIGGSNTVGTAAPPPSWRAAPWRRLHCSRSEQRRSSEGMQLRSASLESAQRRPPRHD